MPGPQRPGSEDRGQGDKSVKKIKQETAEDFYSVPKAQLAAGVGTDSGLASHSVSQSPKPNNSLSHHALPHKPLQLDADCLVGGVSSSLLGHSFPHKPLRGSISSSVSKPSMMSTSSPRHQDLSSVSTQGLSTLPGAGSELMEDLLNHGGSEGPLGNLTPSSPSGMNPDLDLLGAETKGEATGTVNLSLSLSLALFSLLLPSLSVCVCVTTLVLLSYINKHNQLSQKGPSPFLSGVPEST